MFEGHDTTAAGLNWFIYNVALRPEIQEKIYKEVSTVLTSDFASEPELAKLTYLACVLKESLRAYPSVPGFGRECSKDFEIDGHIIRKGTIVEIWPYLIHRNEEDWENPNEFIPERWINENENEKKRHPYSYIPFSSGPRNCIGQNMALHELKVTLAYLFRNFKFTISPAQDIQRDFSIILRPLKYLFATVERRK